jgi:hypothetical protein
MIKKGKRVVCQQKTRLKKKKGDYRLVSAYSRSGLISHSSTITAVHYLGITAVQRHHLCQHQYHR